MVSESCLSPRRFSFSPSANPNARDKKGLSALSCACDESEAVGRAMVKDLLEAGADPTVAPGDGVLPLHLASRADNPDAIELLVAAAPSVLNRRDARGISPLCWASGAGSPRAVSSLLAAGASDRQALQAGGTGPLALAVGGNDPLHRTDSWGPCRNQFRFVPITMGWRILYSSFSRNKSYQ